MRREIVLASIALAALLLAPITFRVSADSGARSYDYLIGSGFLCGLDPSACPTIARADSGDTVEITGEGRLTIHPKSVTGGGTFTHKNAAGDVLGSGTWTAEQLLSFNSYGNSPDLPPFVEGGLAIISVHLSAGFDAVLQVDCLVGSPPAGATEGVRLNVEDAINFNKELSGATVYIRTS